ncbi:hypothetical protein B0H14DRAFT_3457154 [Mycena olivaceomarginata]|nr:hypothetical protein B0H14DRAFT_3457154 [Mycena olivaceomarginata]
MAVAALRFRPAPGKWLLHVLKLWMPPSLVHYPVVAAVNEILVDLHEISSCKDFQALDIFDEWITFIDLAERRIALMRRVDSIQWLKACDNLDVAERFKPGLSADGAPDAAPTTATLGAKLSIGRAAGIPTATYLCDCLAKIAESPLCRLGVHEHGEPCFTSFDYTSSTVQIGVQRVSQSSTAGFVKYPGSGWADIMARACAQKSRTIYDALRGLANYMPGTQDQNNFTNELEDILADSADLVEIH